LRKIEAVFINNSLFAVQVFKDLKDLRAKLDDEAWEDRATNDAGEPLVPPSPIPIVSILDINSRPRGRRTGGSPSHKEKPGNHARHDDEGKENHRGETEGQPSSQVIPVRPPKTGIPTLAKSTEQGPSYRRVASGQANLRLEECEMPEVPEDTFVTQEDAVEFLEAQETREERNAVRFISSQFKDMKEAIMSAVAMCEDFDVSCIFG
jgi:hypothetical protein